MSVPDIYVKAGTYAASAIPMLQAGVAYALNAVVRIPGSAYAKCMVAGTTASANMYVNLSAPNAYVVNGSSSWYIFSGEDGRVANTWTVAADTITAALFVGTSKPSGMPRAGRSHDVNFPHDAARVYVDSASQFSAWGSMYGMFVDLAELVSGTFPLQQANPIYPASRLRVISANAATYPATPQSGATIKITKTTLNTSIGRNEWSGLTFVLEGAVMMWGERGWVGTEYNNTRLIADNLFTGCTVVLKDDPNGNWLRPTWAVGGGSWQGWTRSRVYEFHEHRNTVFDIQSGAATIALCSDAQFYNCVFSSSNGAYPVGGLFSFTDNGRAPDGVGFYNYANGASTLDGVSHEVAARFVGCSFNVPLRSLVRPLPFGKVTITMEGCQFAQGTVLTDLLSSLSPSAGPDIRLELSGCGVVSEIDALAYAFITPCVLVQKVRGIYRNDEFFDRDGSRFSFLGSTKGGLSKLYGAQELPHMVVGVPAGRVEVSLYVASPSSALLTAADFFMYVVLPDGGGDTLPTSPQTVVDGATANFFSTKAADPDVFESTYPVVADSWTALPDGWVVQKVSIRGTAQAEGQAYCIPWIAKHKAEFIMCSAPEVSLR